MDLERTQSLAFLLSLFALPIAGCGDAPADTTSGSTGDSTGDSQTTDPTDSDPTVDSATTDPTNASNSMSATSPTSDPTTDPSTDPSDTDPSDTDPSDTDPTDDTSTTDPTDPTDATTSEEGTTDPTDEGTTGGDPLCTGFAAHVVECIPKYAPYEQTLFGYCTEAIAYYAAYSPECGIAGEEFFACLAIADCQELENGEPCPEEVVALETACGGGGSSSGGDSNGE